MGENPLERKRILIVDDEEAAGQALASILKRAGYETECAVSGPEALGKARKSGFDLVFLDIDLPEMSGLEVFKNLKKIDGDAKVCLVTGWPKGIENHAEDYLALLHEGAIDKMLRKPFTKEDVLKAVEDILKA